MGVKIREYGFTLAILGVMVVVYAGQLVLAGNLTSGAAYQVATSLSTEAYILFTPWLHSTHRHLVENAIVFALLGAWTEPRVNSFKFGVIAVATGYMTNLAPAVFGFGGFGLGASGITNALWANFTAVQLSQVNGAMQTEPFEWRRVLGHLGLSFVGLVFVLKSISEFVGYTEPLAGSATGAHLLGVVIGGVWFIYRHNRGPSVRKTSR